MRLSHIKLLGKILGVILLFIGIVTIPFIGKIYPNIYVANTYVGDLSKENALEEISKVKVPEKMTLEINDKKAEVVTSDLIKNVDFNKSVERAYNLSNSGNLFLDLKTKLNLILKPKNLGLVIEFDEEKIHETLIILSSKEGSKPVLPSAKIVSGTVQVDKGKNGVEMDVNKVASDIKNKLTFVKNETVKIDLIENKAELTDSEANLYKSKLEKLLGKKLELKLDFDTIELDQEVLIKLVNPKEGFNKEAIKKEIVDVSRKVNRNPQDSVFVVENGTVKEFTPSKDGITVDEDKLVSEIETNLSKLLNEETKLLSFTIPVVKAPAKIQTEDVNDLGIKTLLGKGISHFKGSIPNRIHNVNLAQSKFKGILIPPGKVFSFNEVLGDVSSYTGYKAAYVIKDGKTVLGDGGGVCQVSTTLFRAILSAGLPIVERKPHSYRVGYYEQGFGPGLDATVFYPTTDLKFKNDTENYLLLQPSIDNPNYTLTFEIYGTDDGRVSEVSKPVITSSTAPAGDLYVDDPTIPSGQVRQIEHRAYGARVVFDYKVTRNGESLIDQQFISNYRSWQAVYLKGTGI